MRKVVAYMLVSVDGVAEDPERFLFDFDEVMEANLDDVIGTQDTVLLGRRMYDEWSGYWPTSDVQPFADFINSVQKYVATATPLTTTWTNAEAIEGPVEDFVRELQAGEGGDIGVHGSISLTQSLLAAGLVDEVRLLVAPRVAGAVDACSRMTWPTPSSWSGALAARPARCWSTTRSPATEPSVAAGPHGSMRGYAAFGFDAVTPGEQDAAHDEVGEDGGGRADVGSWSTRIAVPVRIEKSNSPCRTELRTLPPETRRVR